ncbi:uncharacterized protein Tco025E_08983 [Trypanosoma conorhini]|uniref:Uncharacterized protein n=1 Tax=Trypanosoma conorhini TaxID=83891 RepID=A0A422N299_9TRYP|nr:uncharacterized protein Tco025E_08983 [Trypanosoma conorhini]RNE99584.1 hypothetical protein Tco025E_08983 [Trypanosoma conorhini]
MNCTTAENSALHNLSKGVSDTLTISETEDPLGASDVCEFSTFGEPATEVRSELQPSEQRQPAGPPQQQPANAAAASSSARTHDGDRARNGGSTATVGEQPGSAAGSTGSQGQSAEDPRETPTPSVGNAASPTQATVRAADGPGGTQTPSNSQGRSDAPNAAPSAGGSDATTTTGAKATDRSPSDGKDAKRNADGSATNSNTTQKAVANAADRSATSSSFVRAPLMLLLTAALACAAT